MDYRNFVEKYGTKINKALTDQAYIDWLIETLQAEGFGTAKAVSILDGFKTKAVKISEDATTIVFQIDSFEANPPAITSVIDQGNSYEWGQVLNPGDLTIDITVTRRTYALDSLTFTGLNATDQDRTAINAAGVNDNLTVDYNWDFLDTQDLNTLQNGDTVVGTVTAVDEKGQTVVNTISITRLDRWYWGLTQSPMTAADIATAIGTKTANIVPSDADTDFRELTSGTGNFPSQLDVDTFGSERTLFICTIPEVEFTLESGVPYVIPTDVHNINNNNMSGGVANVTRSYNVQTIDLNTLVTLLTV